MRFVVDSSSIISLHAGGVLNGLFSLASQVDTTNLVAAELTEPDAQHLRQMGLNIHSLSDSETQHAEQIALNQSSISLQDASVIVLCLRLGAFLLVDDKPLRTLEQGRFGLQVHGSLWILEELVANKLISVNQLCEALNKMIQSGQRLPAQVVRKLRKKYGCPSP